MNGYVAAMRATLIAVLLTLAACSGNDKTVEPGQDAACAGTLEVYKVALQAWYLSGHDGHPDEEALIAESFLSDTEPDGYVEIVAGSSDTQATAQPGPECD